MKRNVTKAQIRDETRDRAARSARLANCNTLYHYKILSALSLVFPVFSLLFPCG